MRPPNQEDLKALGVWATLLGGVVGGLFAVHSYIDWRIATRINAPQTLQEIASLVRPAVIFDSEGRILADQGGYRYLEEIRYETGSEGQGDVVVVVPHNFLAVAPLLESIDEEGFNLVAERGPGIEWHFRLRDESIYESGVQNPRFRLEILK